MDKQELLNKIIDSLISSDDVAAKAAFSEFATLKTTEIVQAPPEPKVAPPKAE